MSTLTNTFTRSVPITVVHSPDMPAASKVSARPFSWAETQWLVEQNDLSGLARSPKATEEYLAFKRTLRLTNTTVFKHLLTKLLQWATPEEVAGLADNEIRIASLGRPLFTEASDIKIILNDFPYYFEPDVTHMCVWTKQPIPSDPISTLGDISPQLRARIEAYVVKTFVEGLGVSRDKLVWLRNWDALQSVKEISHIHVIVKGLLQQQLDKVLGTPGVPLDP